MSNVLDPNTKVACDLGPNENGKFLFQRKEWRGRKIESYDDYLTLHLAYIVQLAFQVNRPGDSGGPVIWEDKDDNYRAYLVGIMNQILSKPPKCGTAVTIPGTVFNWVLDKGGKEVEDCLVQN